MARVVLLQIARGLVREQRIGELMTAWQKAARDEEGRPKGSKDRLPRAGSPTAKSVKHAWARVTDADPALLDRAIK